MISLDNYRLYWESVADRVPALKGAMPVTVDEQMGKRIQALGAADTPVLFFFPPAAESRGGSVDAFSEGNLCVIFVMGVYDPQRSTSFETLAALQPVADEVKRLMLADMSCGCSDLRIDVRTINTQPETEFYRNMAGWSIGFTAIS